MSNHGDASSELSTSRDAKSGEGGHSNSTNIFSRRIGREAGNAFNEFVYQVYLPLAEKYGSENVRYADFCFGNPHDPPIPAFAHTLQEQASIGVSDVCPPSLFQYQFRFDEEREAVLRALHRRRGQAYEATTIDDILITNGAFGGLLMVLHSFTDAGDKIVVPSPDYFGYEGMINALECSKIYVPLDEVNNFDLDVPAIQRAFLDNPDARVLILTCPNNPSGNLYTRERFQELSLALQHVNEVRGQQNLPPVVLLSDEAYHRIIFPSTGRPFVSPAEEYPWTVSVYSYGKTCMAPSERLGWVTLGPLWPDLGEVNTKGKARNMLMRARMSLGLLVPSYTNARCIPRIEDEDVCVDVQVLQRRRDALVAALKDEKSPFPAVIVPESGFYLLAKIPFNFSSDVDLCKLLGTKYRILVMPMSMASELPGWLRLSVTASDDMIEHAVEGLKKFGDDYLQENPKGIEHS
jgi:aspartate aminotransferase